MQWTLFVLILMGQCCFFACHHYEYHFVKECKTWTEAQQYCREHYTDLATVSNKTDVQRLSDAAQKTKEAWIGLHNQPAADGTWQWSQSELELDKKDPQVKWEKMAQRESPPENCGFLRKNLRGGDTSCDDRGHFICYNDTGKSKEFYLIKECLNWQDAQKHCRDYYKGLVSGKEQLADRKLSEKIKSETTEMFIDLFRNTWRWSDNRSSSFTHWDPDFQHQPQKKRCAVTMNGRWKDSDCDDKKPFFCYDDKVILIKEEKNWTDALNYCRKNHHDLVSITNHTVQKLVQKKAEMARTTHVWLGMRFTCTLDLWFWVNDNLICYDNWAPEEKTEGCDRAAAMSKDGKWFEKSDTEQFNFVCALNPV